MFKPSENPRIYGVAPGVDFPNAVAAGILDRLKASPPDALARVQILVNTRRMQRRLRSIFASGPARLLPRIGLVTEIDDFVLNADLPSVIDPVRRRLDIASLVAKLIDADPSLAPRAALFDLTDSLVALLDELHGEGVAPEAITDLKTGDLSGHWERSRQFLSIVTAYLAENDELHADPEARRRTALLQLLLRWEEEPPRDPVLIVGSTGSRATTFELMKCVSTLPQGAIILPGFDSHLPNDLWARLAADQSTEDHPQYRFARLLSEMKVNGADIEAWHGEPPSEARNALISLSLRPAPVTDQWMTDGARLKSLEKATEDVTMLEAPNARLEALAIAVAMRDALAAGRKVALVSPDRTLGRRVAAALLRWDLVADDSAGRPLAQTAPGRLLRQVMLQIGQTTTSEALIALLRHPLARTDGTDRGDHLLMTQELELFLRKKSVHHVDRQVLAQFADIDPSRNDWTNWISDFISELERPVAPGVGSHIRALVERTEALCRGPGGAGNGELWEKEAGRDTRSAIDGLLAAGDAGPEVGAADVRRLLDRALQTENTRNSDESRTDLMIWGTLEARVQGADTLILAGLNEGTWPSRPGPDPWLNRAMRKELGLLQPERQIGLSAHDYQQAVAARHVILSRALKDDDAETIAARWINRLTSLLNGLPEQGGDAALVAMRNRGERLVSIARDNDRPKRAVDRSPRPAPAPPAHLRPKILSVTEVEKLIRDPYAIYARHVLKLRSLKTLRQKPDAAMRGTVIHAIFHRLMTESPFETTEEIASSLIHHANAVLEAHVPWPSVRAHWLAHLTTISLGYAEAEMRRQSEGRPVALEVWGEHTFGDGAFGVKGKADRIDRLQDGRLAIYDYKSGGPPSTDQILYFQRQLPIEAVMAEAGAFNELDPDEVAFVSHIGLNKALKSDLHLMAEDDTRDFRTVTIQRELTDLFREYADPARGYPSRRAMEKMRWDGDYDHLARFGEWEVTDPAEVIPLP